MRHILSGLNYQISKLPFSPLLHKHRNLQFEHILPGLDLTNYGKDLADLLP